MRTIDLAAVKWSTTERFWPIEAAAPGYAVFATLSIPLGRGPKK